MIRARHRTGAVVGWVRSRRGPLAYWAGLLVVAVGLAFTASTVLDLIARADRGQADRVALRSELAQSRTEAQALAEQVESLGAEPVVTPDPAGPMPGPAGERGPRGPQGVGPSPEQVAAAVAAYCAGGRCAAPPSDPQVTAAVVAYCAEGRCTGRDGAAGAAGTAGDPGTPGEAGPPGPAGEPGPAPTAEAVRAAVDAYCADVGCTGPPGETGPPGRGINALACESAVVTGTTRITVTYSDGSTQTVDCTTLAG